MKVQCPSCREIVEMSDFATSEAGLKFKCSGCQAENFLGNPRQSQAPDPEPSPEPRPTSSEEIICPKCGHAQYDPEACHRCGLMFDRFDPSRLPPDPAEAASIWDLILMKPDDQDLHERFIAACFSADRLDYATRQYRRWSRESARTELAEKMLGRVAQKGQTQVAPSSLTPAARGSKRTAKLLIWIIVGISLGLFAYYILRTSNMIGQSWP